MNCMNIFVIPVELSRLQGNWRDYLRFQGYEWRQRRWMRWATGQSRSDRSIGHPDQDPTGGRNERDNGPKAESRTKGSSTLHSCPNSLRKYRGKRSVTFDHILIQVSLNQTMTPEGQSWWSHSWLLTDNGNWDGWPQVQNIGHDR